MPPPPPAPAEPVPPVPEAPREELPWRLAGEVLQTYLIVERGEEILFIDKHAAHERMNFDRMKQEGYQPMAQTLLAPVIFTPSPEEGAPGKPKEECPIPSLGFFSSPQKRPCPLLFFSATGISHDGKPPWRP